MVRIKTKNLKYATKELISSVSVFLDLTEPKRNETTEIPKFTEIVLFRSSTVMICLRVFAFLGILNIIGEFRRKIKSKSAIKNSKIFKTLLVS